MAQEFKYIDASGQEQRVTASSADEAMKIAPNIGASSGVMAVTQQNYDRAQNPNQPVNPMDISGATSTQLPERSNLTDTAMSSLSMGVNALPPSQLTAQSSDADVMATLGRTTPTEQKQLGLVSNIEASLKKMLGKSERGAELFKESGLEQKQLQLNELDKQLAQEQRALENELRRLEKNPEGVFGPGALQGQMGRIRSESLQRQADLSIIKAGVQGDISTAQSIIQQKLDLEFAPIQEEIEYYSSLLQLSQTESGILDKKEQDQLNFILNARQEEKNSAEAEKKMRYELGYQLAAAGDTAGARAVFAGQMDIGEAYIKAGQAQFAAAQTTPTAKRMSESERQEFAKDFGWQPPMGMSYEEALQFTRDNPTSSPDELRKAAEEFYTNRPKTLSTEDIEKSFDDTIKTITDSLTSEELEKFAKRHEDMYPFLNRFTGKKGKVTRLFRDQGIREFVRIGLAQGKTADQIKQELLNM